ncbi:MAG: hypothetical protein ACYDBQ_05735 [Thermoplasmatota archaeon]
MATRGQDRHGEARVMAGVLERMGSVLGPEATYSLVHYAALEEGLKLGTQSRPSSPEEAVEVVARVLGLEAATTVRGPARVAVDARSGTAFPASGAWTALVVGLLEGVLTAAVKRRVQIAGEPRAQADGRLVMEFSG